MKSTKKIIKKPNERKIVSSKLKNKYDRECSICNKNITMDNYFMGESCIHIFHPECINKWCATNINNNKVCTCPKCRKPLNKLTAEIVFEKLKWSIQINNLGKVNEVLDKLKEHKEHVNINTKLDNGWSLLHYAIINDSDVEIIKLLVNKGANIDAEDLKGRTPIHYAKVKNNTEILNWLKEKKEESNKNLLIAAGEGDIEGVKSALKAGADVDAKDKEGNTALMVASYNGEPEVVTELITAKAKVDAKTSRGLTALYMASKEGHAGVVTLLLEKSAAVKYASRAITGRSSFNACFMSSAFTVGPLLRASKGT